METEEALKLFDQELWYLIEKAHRSGMSYWSLLKLVPDLMKDLIIKADVEYKMKGGL